MLLKTKFDKQSDHSENGIAAVKNLVRLANIRVTASSVSKIKDYEGYPSLTAISECLSNWNIEKHGGPNHRE
jgi:hypothetical protein